MDFIYPKGDGMFQDDCQWAHIARNCFEKNSGQFRHMIWQPKLPDMNPMQHIWDMRDICAHNSIPTTTKDL